MQLTDGQMLSTLARRCVVSLVALFFAGSGLANAQTALPIEDSGIPISTRSPARVTLDLSTIPNRAELHINVTTAHPQAIVTIELGNWAGLPVCPNGLIQWDETTPPTWSPPGVGAATLEKSLWGCNPFANTSFWDDGTVDVTVHLSGNVSSTTISADIRGVTLIPTNEFFEAVDTSGAPETAALRPTRDTVIYQSNSAASNGQGDYLWAGYDYRLVGLPPAVIPVRYRLNSLIAFDDLLTEIPIGSIVTHASLDLTATTVLNSGGPVRVHDIAPSSLGEPWIEGNTVAANEFVGVVAPPAADWFDRQGTADPWATAGGDFVSPALVTKDVTKIGSFFFSSAALEDSLQDTIDTRIPREGFLLRGPGFSSIPGDVAVEFASGQNPTLVDQPRLVVDYLPPAHTGGTIGTGTVIYIGEGENFRWVYDNDDDGLLYTAIGGVCEALPGELGNGTENDFNYSYEGAPGYVGTDCCAWWIDAPQTGVLGTGQVIFFHNLDPTNPANLPPDTDGDGMRDGCDNCVNVPNGPYLGTCLGLNGPGATCTADTDCGPYEFCSQSQEDLDRDQTGDACAVPEPGFGAMLGVSLAGLGALARRRPRARSNA